MSTLFQRETSLAKTAHVDFCYPFTRDLEDQAAEGPEAQLGQPHDMSKESQLLQISENARMVMYFRFAKELGLKVRLGMDPPAPGPLAEEELREAERALVEGEPVDEPPPPSEPQVAEVDGQPVPPSVRPGSSPSGPRRAATAIASRSRRRPRPKPISETNLARVWKGRAGWKGRQGARRPRTRRPLTN